jgi:hypothetical protein
MSASILPPCSPLGIGSLPHRDPLAAVRAIQAVPGFVPFWPQLPNRSPRETILLHALGPFLEDDPPRDGDGRPVLSDEGRLRLREVPSEDVELDGEEPWILRVPEWSAGWIEAVDAFEPKPDARVFKGHLPGPVTLGLHWRDPRGRPLVENVDTMNLVVNALHRYALYQIESLRDRGWIPLLFLDEPGLLASDDTAARARSRGEPYLRRTLQFLKEAGAGAGVHACGQARDPFLFALGADFVSFEVEPARKRSDGNGGDRSSFVPPFAGCLPAAETFLREGGQLVWGVVPSREPFAEEDFRPSERWFPVVKAWREGREDWHDVLGSSHVSSACGLAGLTEDKSQAALRLTALTCVIARMALATRESWPSGGGRAET